MRVMLDVMEHAPNINDKPLDEMSDVFGLFASNIELAGILSVGQSTVSEMKRRKSIPPQYWPPIVAAVAEKGRSDLTLEKFVQLAARRAARQGEAA
jgi:hypothetical protein